MSYILEALKKAQAERQLGNAPTIHAPAVHPVPAARARRLPLAAGVAATVVIAGAVLFAWRQQTPAPQVPAAGPAQPAPPVAAAQQPAAPAILPAQPAPALAAPAVARPSPAPQVALLPEPTVRTEPPARSSRPARAEAVAAPAPPQAAADPARPAQAQALPAEDTTRGFGDLPEAVRRDVPKVVFGGYIYSPNPADRLLLVDKMLRREGEEVAPGLVLEKLLPNAAVMNYRGQRYRVPY